MSPGPSMAVILKNSMNYSWKHGVFTSFGTIFGICLQAFAVLIGFQFISKHQYYYACVGIILALYLLYIGKDLLFSVLNTHHDDEKIITRKSYNESNKSFPLSKVFKEGFYIDALNPLALSFFLAIFSTYINLNNGFWINFLCWLEIVLLGSLWYIGFSFFISMRVFQEIIFVRMEKILNLIMCLVIFYLAIKILRDNICILMYTS
jgi:threonine/homoserine/homoserine lactone efflux protein